MSLTRLFQIGAWACLAVIGALSLVAPRLRPVTFLPHNAEHVAIFVLAGLAVGLGYPNRNGRHMIMLAVFAAVVEVAQFVTPGRHPRLSDFAVDTLGAWAGVALALAITRLLGKAASPR